MILQTMKERGFDYDEITALLRASNTLSRWNERECNGEVQVDDSGKAERVWYDNKGTRHGYTIPNREASTLKRVETILSKHPGHFYYYQGDPRGCALYLFKPGDIKEGERIDSLYSSRGLALCID